MADIIYITGKRLAFRPGQTKPIIENYDCYCDMEAEADAIAGYAKEVGTLVTLTDNVGREYQALTLTCNMEYQAEELK